MRPKAVLIIFVVAIVVVMAIIFVKGLGVLEPDVVDVRSETTEVAVVTNASSVTVESPTAEAQTHEEERAVRIDKEIDQVNDAVARGSSDPMSLVKITDRLTHPEKEVREAAIRGARLLGDSAAIKNLKVAKDQLEDPREKASILDVIDYLEMEREGEGPSTNSPAIELGPGSQSRPAATPATPVPPK